MAASRIRREILREADRFDVLSQAKKRGKGRQLEHGTSRT